MQRTRFWKTLKSVELERTLILNVRIECKTFFPLLLLKFSKKRALSTLSAESSRSSSSKWKRGQVFSSLLAVIFLPFFSLPLSLYESVAGFFFPTNSLCLHFLRRSLIRRVQAREKGETSCLSLFHSLSPISVSLSSPWHILTHVSHNHVIFLYFFAAERTSTRSPKHFGNKWATKKGRRKEKKGKKTLVGGSAGIFTHLGVSLAHLLEMKGIKGGREGKFLAGKRNKRPWR